MKTNLRTVDVRPIGSSSGLRINKSTYVADQLLCSLGRAHEPPLCFGLRLLDDRFAVPVLVIVVDTEAGCFLVFDVLGGLLEGWLFVLAHFPGFRTTRVVPTTGGWIRRIRDVNRSDRTLPTLDD